MAHERIAALFLVKFEKNEPTPSHLRFSINGCEYNKSVIDTYTINVKYDSETKKIEELQESASSINHYYGPDHYILQDKDVELWGRDETSDKSRINKITRYPGYAPYYIENIDNIYQDQEKIWRLSNANFAVRFVAEAFANDNRYFEGGISNHTTVNGIKTLIFGLDKKSYRDIKIRDPLEGDVYDL